MTGADVVVVGCGLMGSAMVRAFAGAGRSVAAWNRTPERALALAGERVAAVRDVAGAVAPLVVACTSTCEAALEALDPVRDWRGRTLVTLPSGTPADAEAARDWVVDRGGEHLDGVILCYPQEIGSPDAVILYAGPSGTWAAHGPVLGALAGASRHVAEEVGTAKLLDAGLTGAFYVSALVAYAEAAGHLIDRGTPPDVLRALTGVALEILRHATDEVVTALVTDEHTTDQATITTFAEGARAALTAVRATGSPAHLLTAALHRLDTAVAAGSGSLAVSALGLPPR
ncbi:NAD(P)-binding domain-containing protein [Actinosynnema mirum]|uniref:NAD(P)-binding domain-containing protein n=1 Tax=Actinosynnema mirum TaxID=40567 RepID=UPI0002E6A9CD|nr:NAD(P)-binding domain-containing protein [Actinosynnema mirum]